MSTELPALRNMGFQVVQSHTAKL
ncbi:hypothetical protein [Tritonibacter mobilis]